MRCDQSWGLCPNAEVFLEKNELPIEKCPCCRRDFPKKLETIGHYEGMFEQEYPLHRHTLKDGRFADEFLQADPWSSGPVAFLGLRVSDGSEILWTDDEIEEHL